ncbi:hypothetical protein ACWERS_35940, partial [Actinopolymorpha pittospori]
MPLDLLGLITALPAETAQIPSDGPQMALLAVREAPEPEGLTRKSHGHQAGGSEPRPLLAGQGWSGGWLLG